MRKITSLFALLSLLGSTAAFAAQRHRIVNVPAVQQVTLKGQVTDLTGATPVVEVEVSAAGRFARTDSEGKFTFEVPKDLPFTLKFARTGYETKSETFTATGPLTRTFQLRSLPTARIVTTTGTTHVVDADSVEFGYAIPFLGIRHDPKAKMCRAGGQKFDLDRADVDRIVGPAVTTTDAACCPTTPAHGAVFHMSSGETFTAYFTDSCEHPHMQLFARDHATWQLVSVELSELQEATIP